MTNMKRLQTFYIILFGVLTSISGILSQTNQDLHNVASENSQLVQRHPPPPIRPARQQRPSQQGFGGLLSGLLGTITKTGESKECPGMCIHALASLLCGQVRDDIQCPSTNMKCCVEKPRRKKKKPSQSQDTLSNNVRDNTTTRKPTTIKKVKKTKRKPTTERTTTTTQKQGANDKHGNEDGDYDYTDGNQGVGDTGSSSRFKQYNIATAFVLCLITYLLQNKNLHFNGIIV